MKMKMKSTLKHAIVGATCLAIGMSIGLKGNSIGNTKELIVDDFEGYEEQVDPDVVEWNEIMEGFEKYLDDYNSMGVSTPEELMNLSVEKQTHEVDLDPEEVELGEYTITGYCSCEKCCGKWAKNRPDGIVRGAYGRELKVGHSIASPLANGTKVEIEGLGTYVVDDTTANWVVDKYDGKIIDMYFGSHEECENFKTKANVKVVK